MSGRSNSTHTDGWQEPRCSVRPGPGGKEAPEGSSLAWPAAGLWRWHWQKTGCNSRLGCYKRGGNVERFGSLTHTQNGPNLEAHRVQTFRPSFASPCPPSVHPTLHFLHTLPSPPKTQLHHLFSSFFPLLAVAPVSVTCSSHPLSRDCKVGQGGKHAQENYINSKQKQFFCMNV